MEAHRDDEGYNAQTRSGKKKEKLGPRGERWGSKEGGQNKTKHEIAELGG